MEFDETFYDPHTDTPTFPYSVLAEDVNYSRTLIPAHQQIYRVQVEYERVLEFGNIVGYLANLDVSLIVDSTYKFANDGPGVNYFLHGDIRLDVSNSLDILGILIRDETGAIRTDVDVTSSEGVNYPLLSAPIVAPPPPPPSSKVIISPVAVTENGLGTFNDDVVLENTIDHSGLAKAFVSGEISFDEYVFEGASPRSDNDFHNYWQSGLSLNGQFAGALDFDLGEEYLVDRLAVWNGTLEDVEVLVALAPEGPWQSVGAFTLQNQNPLVYPIIEPEVLDLAGSHLARYLRLEVDSAYPYIFGQNFEYAILREIAVSAMPDIEPPGLPGDINLDGTVNRTDAALFGRYYGMSSGGTWTTGDFDLDGAVTWLDLALLQAHLGQSIALSPSSAVPEPSGVLLLAFGVFTATIASGRLCRRGAYGSPSNRSRD